MTDLSTLFSTDQMEFTYEPYPLGYGAPFFAAEMYEELLATWPSKDLFQYMPVLGSKYSLSEVNASENYHRFLAATPGWNRLFRWVKSEAFVREVLQLLKRRNIDLDLMRLPVDTAHGLSPAARRVWARLNRRRHRLRTRFEFSMMSAAGGHILPHTDHPAKRITIVLSMNGAQEWQESWGGGTAVQKPVDRTLTYNHINRQLRFEDCEVQRVFPFLPNQCLLFIKTFNSLHAVYPMGGPEHAMRRTLTINIEELGG